MPRGRLHCDLYFLLRICGAPRRALVRVMDNTKDPRKEYYFYLTDDEARYLLHAIRSDINSLRQQLINHRRSFGSVIISADTAEERFYMDLKQRALVNMRDALLAVLEPQYTPEDQLKREQSWAEEAKGDAQREDPT